MIYLSVQDDEVYPSGKMFSKKYIKIFSSKGHQFWKLIENGLKEGKGTFFTFSNYKSFGSDVMEQILLNNGFLTFKQD